jgi:hypothetical protein
MTKPRTPKASASRIPTTESEYERLLADAEQDLLVPWADLTRGRPRVGESKASEQTAIRLPTELMAALRARAEREHKALNAVIRDACTAWALHPPHQP